MSRSKPMTAMTTRGPLTAVGRSAPARQLMALALRAASSALDRLAERVAAPAEPDRGAPAAAIEFYAQAGAPEGALYVDGQFVGWIHGVQRL